MFHQYRDRPWRHSTMHLIWYEQTLAANFLNTIFFQIKMDQEENAWRTLFSRNETNSRVVAPSLDDSRQRGRSRVQTIHAGSEGGHRKSIGILVCLDVMINCQNYTTSHEYVAANFPSDSTACILSTGIRWQNWIYTSTRMNADVCITLSSKTQARTPPWPACVAGDGEGTVERRLTSFPLLYGLESSACHRRWAAAPRISQDPSPWNLEIPDRQPPPWSCSNDQQVQKSISAWFPFYFLQNTTSAVQCST